MGGAQVLNAYKEHQSQMTAKHLNSHWEKKSKSPQFGSPEDKAKWEHEKSKLKQKKVDLEALLKLDEELWNS